MQKKDVERLIKAVTKDKGVGYVSEYKLRVFYSKDFKEYFITNGHILLVIDAGKYFGLPNISEENHLMTLVESSLIVKEQSIGTLIDYKRVQEKFFEGSEQDAFKLTVTKDAKNKGIVGYAIKEKTGIFLSQKDLSYLPEGEYLLTVGGGPSCEAVKFRDNEGVTVILSALTSKVVVEDKVIVDTVK